MAVRFIDTKDGGGEEMGVVTEISKLFLFDFSLMDYVVEKAVDAGTGRLWKLIRERMEQKGCSAIEAGIYEAIEKTTRVFLPENCPEEPLACVCELILSSWCRKKYMNDADIRSAWERCGFGGSVHPDDWLFLFYQNVYKDETLKAYLEMYQNSEILRLLNQLVSDGISRSLEKTKRSGNGTAGGRPDSGGRTDCGERMGCGSWPDSRGRTDCGERMGCGSWPDSGGRTDFGRVPDFGTRIRYGDLKEYVDDFVGRADELKQIREILEAHKTAVITAGPGYGKTSLAVRFGQRYEEDYDRILFISCETAVDIYRSLNMIYENEEVCDLGVRGNILRRIRMLITGVRRPLLIFDNYGYDHIADYQRLGALENALRAVIDELSEDYVNLDIIVTTRITQTLFLRQGLCLVDEMSSGDAKEYLRQGNDCFSEAECAAIIRDWGTLPIVLNMVKTVTGICGGYSEVSSIYMNMGGGVHNNLYPLFKKLFQELCETEEGRIFAEILNLSCLLDSDNIQKDLLFRALANSSTAVDRPRFDMILANYVRRLNILRGTGDNYTIHRMYQETIRHLLNTPRRQVLMQCIVRELRAKLHWFSYYGYSEWGRMKDYLNHIDRLYVAMDASERGAYADLFLQSAWYSGYVINDFALYDKYKSAIGSGAASGTETYIRGIALCDDVLIHIHSGQKTAHIQADQVWKRIENLRKQLTGSRSEILYIRYCLCRSEYEERTSGSEMAMTWAQNGVSACLNEDVVMACLDEDLALEDEDLLRSTFFPEHLMLLKNQLGRLYRQQAQTDKAIEMFTQVLDIIEDIQQKAFEPDNNYDVIRAFTVNALAVCYYERNRSDQDLKQALANYREAYDIYERLQYYFGMVNALLNCAAIYRLLALNVLEHRESPGEGGMDDWLAIYQGYLHDAGNCLDAIAALQKQGVRISKKLLKDFYTYHYELDIARSRHPLLGTDQVREILLEAGGWLKKSMEIAKKEDYRTDKCRQERYQGILYRKLAMLTEGEAQKSYLVQAIEILEAAIKDSNDYQLTTSLYYARMELALTWYYYGNWENACQIILDMAQEVDRCSQDSVKKRYAVVRSMIKYEDGMK